MNKQLIGPFMLFLAALIWGSSFIIMKNTVDFLTPNILLAIRFFIAATLLTLIFIKRMRQVSLSEIKMGIQCGVLLYLAYTVQTFGLNQTTPSKNAFLTAVYVAIVPFLVWICYPKRPDRYNFIAAFLCIIGIGLTTLNESWMIQIGDLLTLIGGFIWAIHILVNKNYAEKMDPICFTILQFITTALCAFISSILFEDISIIRQIKVDIIFQLGYLAVFATALALLLQTIGQMHTSECNAALILSLESVFGTLFSILFYGEVLTIRTVFGFLIIFIAIIISETKLTFMKRG